MSDLEPALPRDRSEDEKNRIVDADSDDEERDWRLLRSPGDCCQVAHGL